MRKHAETFHSNKGYKLAIIVFIPASLYQHQTLVTQKHGLMHSFFYKNELLKYYLSNYMIQIAMFLVLGVRFFQRIRFLLGPFYFRSIFRVHFIDVALKCNP